MKVRLVSGVASGCLFVAAAFGQGAVTTGTATSSSTSGFFTASGGVFVVPPVTGAAYSGEEVTERVQTLADGTHITQTTPGRRIFRDSQGRVRSERSFGVPGRPAAEAPRMIEITDPVAGLRYTLDEQKKVAHRSTLPQQNQPNGVAMQRNASGQWFSGSDALPPPPPPQPGGTAIAARVLGPPAQDGRPQPEFKNEPLGTQTLDGVLCEGRRTTTTYPVDFVGNDRPIVVTQEVWTSPELKMMILSMTNDPRSGENTFHILNLSRTEPDASLFQPPPDYSVVDDSGPAILNGNSGK